MHPPAWCDPWVGLPFEDFGRGPRAFDCWGLVRAVAKARAGHDYPSWDAYDSTEDSATLSGLVAAAKHSFSRVVTPAEGDVVLFRVRGLPCHVGVALGETWFLHTRKHLGSAIERWNSTHWRSRVEGFYRWAP